MCRIDKGFIWIGGGHGRGLFLVDGVRFMDFLDLLDALDRVDPERYRDAESSNTPAIAGEIME